MGRPPVSKKTEKQIKKDRKLTKEQKLEQMNSPVSEEREPPSFDKLI